MRKAVFCLIGTLFVFAAISTAATIRTGVNAGNTVLAPGTTDPTWTISTDGGATFSSTKVLYPAQICCGMETVAGTAAWVSDPSIVDGNAATAWGIDQMVYIRRTIDLTGFDLSTVALGGTWRIADWTMGIYLNGNLIPGTNIGKGDQGTQGTWFSDHAFSVAAGSPFFVAGLNTLEFQAQSINSVYDGIWFDGTLTGRQVGGDVPEPSSLLLLAGGVAAMALKAHRR